ncbi:putative coactivator CBP, KIX domain superfamily, mediator complex subunit 15, KIX [Helianthus annuus]|nr:putative coactivator CBP, KIX domain superfamily, mediator complex subunit 15, KIX [Helianthus annuus]
MDTSNRSLTEGASSAAGDTTMESNDWRAQLHPELRQLIVDKIADTFKSHAPSLGHSELMEQAVSFEKSNYIAATSQSEYIQQTSLKTAAQTSNPNSGDQKGATDGVDDPTLESGDWRAQLEADSRQIFVNKITETLKRCLPFAGDKELQDIAVWFEEKTYTIATSQSNYLRELSVKMLAIDPMQSKSDANSVNPWVLDLIQDWEEEVYQKIKAMKDLYLQDLNVMHQNSLSKLLQHDSRQQPDNEPLEILIRFTHILERCMEFLQTPKHDILAIHKDMLDAYEKAIINVINSDWRNPQQQDQSTRVQSHENENEMSIYILNSMQPSSNLDPGQNSDMKFLQEVSISSLQQNSLSGPHAPNN